MKKSNASGKSSVGNDPDGKKPDCPPPLESKRATLDAETIAGLKVLENPKFSLHVKKALEDKDFLAVILGNLSMDDWLLRWGISRILVQICKRKPERMKDSIPSL